LKRCQYLSHVITELGLQGIRVYRNRAEEISTIYPLLKNNYGIITARALGSIGYIAKLADPLLAQSGLILLPRGGNIKQEWVEFERQNPNRWKVKMNEVHLGSDNALRFFLEIRRKEDTL
jgi:16S rRNA G527 N7-methylase RsmG